MPRPYRSLLLLLIVLACKPVKDGSHGSEVAAFEPTGLEMRDGIPVIPEVLGLETADNLSADLLARFDTRTLAESLVYRLHSLYDDLTTEGAIPNQDWMGQAVLAMRFDPVLLPKIVSNGFLNQHQTRTTKGTFDPGRRRDTEDALIDLNLGPEPRVHSLRPKYCWISFRNGTSIGVKDNDASQYGSWIAVLRPEVKRRATLTFRDSLGIFSRRVAPLARRVLASTFYAKDAYAVNSRYLEAQVWGELDVRDVERFLVPGATLPPELAAVGLPVSSYGVIYENDRYSIVFGPELFPGVPAKVKAFAESLAASRRG